MHLPEIVAKQLSDLFRCEVMNDVFGVNEYETLCFNDVETKEDGSCSFNILIKDLQGKKEIFSITVKKDY